MITRLPLAKPYSLIGKIKNALFGNLVTFWKLVLQSRGCESRGCLFFVRKRIVGRRGRRGLLPRRKRRSSSGLSFSGSSGGRSLRDGRREFSECEPGCAM